MFRPVYIPLCYPSPDHMELRDRDFVAKTIAQDAKTETESTYEERIADYESRNFTYIPMPEDDKFCNVKEGWVKSISEEQWIEPETHLLEVLERLQEQQVLLLEVQTASTKSSMSPILIREDCGKCCTHRWQNRNP